MKYTGKLSIGRHGFNLIELMISTTLISFLIMQASTLAVFFNQKNVSLKKSLDSLDAIQILGKILASEDKCSANFGNKTSSNNINIENIYGIKADKTLNLNVVKFVNNDPNLKIYIDNVNRELVSGTNIHMSNIILKSDKDKIFKELPFYFTTKALSPDRIETCSTDSLAGDLDDTNVVCNSESEGVTNYDFTQEKTLTCINSEWKDNSRNGGSYASMISGYSCKIPNPRTGKCSCPDGYFAQIVYSVENYGCKNGVLDAWYDTNDRENKIVTNGRCGAQVKLCVSR